ncbi:MAG: FtsQ-type POTRA domain-containing protein [Meiothermus sp.]|uniref:cell division protein FtsQ/DivIB n=1 Tax=Meiothermus sp. TaxID=1955249 RepID=UPI0025EB81B4|nr:FtsQ-type POTRA domain-containing protein [Meiothermus sp.]MCS7068231.1 FtsQ-type POTRA domain-containing protein [Meiothermus sp.]MCX7601526.1 FtsQ-type POTRA domain-containing protein [Meiothermus sp.]MDW8425032.1 FtsQ-type POTRA domain-containing protein [Meiothermus sp.]
MIRAVLVALLLATLAVGSYVVLPIEQVEVVGHQQLSEAEVQQLTGLEPGRPWLWAWPSSLEPLQKNPWVKSALLERPAPGRLRIVLEERTPIATLVKGQQRYGLSADGRLLPGAPPKKPVVEGRGEIPLADLLLLMQTFPDAERIRFSSTGFQVLAPNLNVWGQNVRVLQDWAKARRIGKSDASNPLAHPGHSPDSRVYVYSWGVSARR